MGLADIKLKLTPGGSAEAVVVNGQDISHNVRAVRVEASARDIPQVTLQLLGDVVVEGEGIVHLQGDGPDPDEILGAFLAAIDPEELEARALAGAGGLGNFESTGQSFLRALKELAGVDDDGS